MSDLSKLRISGTDYNLKDAQARSDITALNGSLDTLYDVLLDIPNDTEIIKGTYNSSGGVAVNDVRIRISDKVQLSKGETVVYKPGAKAQWMAYVVYSENNTQLYESAWIKEKTEFTLDISGYYIFAFRRKSNAVIDPADMDASVIIRTSRLDELEDATSKIQEFMYINEKIIASDKVARTNYYISGDNVWKYSNSNESTYFFNVRNSKITITANNQKETVYALLSKIPDAYTAAVPFIDGETGRHIIAAGGSDTFTVDEPCILYVYHQTQAGVVYFPDDITVQYATDSTLKIGGKPADALAVSERFDGIIGNRLNYLTSDMLMYGYTINDSGEAEKNDSYVCTDFVKIPQKYKRILNFTHVFNDSGYSGTKAYFYDSGKTFIEAVTPDGYIENNANYYYVRAVYGASDTGIALYFTNETIKPQYTKPQKYTNRSHDLFSYDRITISDGAITAMIRTALKYVNNEEFGYGTEHAAFAESCIKSTKDTHTTSSQYTDERYQIDCSTYVLLIMMGISPECSRYYAGQNIPAEYGFRFNGLAEYEGWVYGVKQTANTKRMYANTMAQYANDNGFLYCVEDTLKNVKAGDILFLSNQGASYNFFENIGHCMFVMATIDNENGTRAIIVAQAGGGSGAPCVITKYESKVAKLVYGARFPMPYVSEKIIRDEVSSVSVTEHISGSTAEENEIYTLHLNNPITKGNTYTIWGFADVPENCYLTVEIDGVQTYDNATRLHRKDGSYIVRFSIPSNSTFVDANDVKIKCVSTGAYDGDVVLKEIHVCNGYITPSAV